MKIPSPQQLGLPEKFSVWRPLQEEAIRLLLTDKSRVTALAIPTGGGKSVIAVAFALITKKPTCYVTDSRGLQDQLMEDFSSIGLVDLRGRRNYPCGVSPDWTCEEGYAAKCPYKGKIHCPATQAEMRAAVSSLVVTNYAKWTSAKKFGQGMQHFQQVIFDEGHKAPEALASAMQVTLNTHEIEEELGIPFPRLNADDVLTWKPWAAAARAEVEPMAIAAHKRLQGHHDPKASWVRSYTHLRHLARRLAIISTARATDWIVDELPRGFQLDPIRPGRYAEAALLLKIPRIVVMSATLRPKTMFMIGVGQKNFTFREFDSEFDPNRCPVYWVPTMRVDSRAKDLSPLWVRLDQILARRRDRKGLVHTISYARRDEIVNASRFASSMLINQKGEASTEMVETFKQSAPGTILVSPSIGAGYDFPMRDGEFQFICKIPFPDGRTKIVKARSADDKEYGPYQAMQSLVQMFGRLMRSREDRSESFIADDHIEWFLPRFGHLAPRSFHLNFRRVDVLPQPPEKL